MAQTINLVAGQISDLIEVGPGTRITVTGSAYVEYAPGNLQDAKNGVLTWQKWPKGTSNGVCDTIRRMTIRATATGDATVQIDEGYRYADTDVGFWQAQTGMVAHGYKANTLVILGDSLTSQNWSWGTATSMTGTIGDTVASIALTGHQFIAGDLVKIDNANQAECNGDFYVISRTDANNFTVRLTSPLTVATATGTIKVHNPKLLANNGYFTWWSFLSGNRVKLLHNAGMSGETTGQILGRIARDVIAYGPSRVAVLAGTNDVRTGVATATIIANLRAIYAQLRANGIEVIAMTIPPLGSGDASYNATTTQQIQDVNAQIKDYCSQFDGMRFVDSHGAIADATSEGGAAAAANIEDTVHFSPVGAYNIGVLLHNAVSSYLPPVNTMPTTAADTYLVSSGNKNVGPNPLFLTSATGPTGTFGGGGGVTEGSGAGTSVAKGWRVEAAGTGSAVASLVARTVANDGDALGNNQRTVLTSSANNDAVSIKNIDTFASQVAAGDSVYAECAFKLSSITGTPKRINLNVNVTVGGVIYSTTTGYGSISNTLPTANISGVMRTPVLKVPAGTVTKVEAVAFVQFPGAGVATLDVGRLHIRKA